MSETIQTVEPGEMIYVYAAIIENELSLDEMIAKIMGDYTKSGFPMTIPRAQAMVLRGHALMTMMDRIRRRSRRRKVSDQIESLIAAAATWPMSLVERDGRWYPEFTEPLTISGPGHC